MRFAPHVQVIPPDDTSTRGTLTAQCEGKASASREALGVAFERHDYGHSATAARLTASAPHCCIARQWFRSPDVLALLPFDTPAAGQSYALVWSLPTERALENALDLLCGDGKALVLGAFDEGALYTAVALRRRGTAFDVVMGPDRLRRDMGLLSGDFARDYRYLSAAVEARLGPIAAGCYAELATFQRLATDPAPGAWAGS